MILFLFLEFSIKFTVTFMRELCEIAKGKIENKVKNERKKRKKSNSKTRLELIFCRRSLLRFLKCAIGGRLNAYFH